MHFIKNRDKNSHSSYANKNKLLNLWKPFGKLLFPKKLLLKKIF